MTGALLEEPLVEEPLEKQARLSERDRRVLLPVCPSIGLQEHEPIRSGSGKCQACDCRGFKKSKDNDGYCGNCGHGYSQHR